MHLKTESYLSQRARWPKEGRHILAQFDAETIVVYQAYRPSIAQFAVENGYFGGGGFLLTRTSWIKPNFLWMMYRSGWATKDGQRNVLAIRLKRSAFDAILAEAVHSTFIAEVYGNQSQWKRALSGSCVRLQWDPDHTPTGHREMRKAIQLGLRGAFLRQYAKDWIVEIEDISEFIAEQRPHAKPSRYQDLLMPQEDIYHVEDPDVIERLGIAEPFLPGGEL